MLKIALGWRYRHFDLHAQGQRNVRLAGFNLWLEPGVFDPTLHFTSGVLARFLQLPGSVPEGARVLDVGTGSGIAALSAARSGAGRVVAVDVNPAAVRAAETNVRRARLPGIIEVRQGDMFAPVGSERFDLIVCNPPYFRGTPTSYAEGAYMAGPRYEWLRRFAGGATAHLLPGGTCLMVLGDAADIRSILGLFWKCGWQTKVAMRRDILVEVIYIFELSPGRE